MTTQAKNTPAPVAVADPVALLRSRQYLQLLVIAAVLGVPISAVAYGFLVLSTHLQGWLYQDLPGALGLAAVPTWWPLPLLGVAGLLVGLVVRYVPGRGGESPLGGFHPGGGPPDPVPLLGIAVAALVSLGFGAVVGPEAPLIAIGGGLAAATVRLARALLADRPLLLLDEPTAHLDDATAARVRDDVLGTAAHRTTVVTSHRPEGYPGWLQLRLSAPEAPEPRAGARDPATTSTADGSWRSRP